MINLPLKVRQVIDTIQEAGYEAYAVGGCVRDTLLGRVPSDWDITTSAKPEEIKKLFPHTFDTGIEHGTITVKLGAMCCEVTTYRIDGMYEDGRHPKEVFFTASLAEDLRRRDFTMNAMAYNPKEGLVDLYGGVADIQAGVIRCVGNPVERFGEDALRILRAVRFAAQLGYHVDEETTEAIRKMASSLRKISAERIQVELMKILVSERPQELVTAYELGITKVILPEVDAMMETTQENPHHCYSVGEHTMKVLMHIRADRILRMAALCHDMGKPSCKTLDEEGIAHFFGHAKKSEEVAMRVMKRLKMDRSTMDGVCVLVRHHDEQIPPTDSGIRKAVNKIGVAYFPGLLELAEADFMAQSTYRREEKRETLAQIRQLYHEILKRQDCLTIADLAIGGKDLLAAGIPQGSQMGQILRLLLEEVLENPDRNIASYLLSRALEMGQEGLPHE